MALGPSPLDVDSVSSCTDLSNRAVKCLWFLCFPGFLEVRNRVLSLPICCITESSISSWKTTYSSGLHGLQQQMSAAWTICTFPRTFVPGLLINLMTPSYSDTYSSLLVCFILELVVSEICVIITSCFVLHVHAAYVIMVYGICMYVGTYVRRCI